ncbi:hypothetical protein MMC25_000280 [Agyrium rufum]|nr:hypothetical protein [Agyrium rufum]
MAPPIKKGIYKPLTKPAEIRLLILEPGEDDELIKCILLNPTDMDSLDTPAESEGSNDLLRMYHALSYVWGDPTDQRVIAVNWTPFFVTANLYSLLSRLRVIMRGERFVLWVDAICIDQSNAVERQTQVSLMSRIYRQSKAVISDIGEAAEDAHLVNPLLASISEAGETCVELEKVMGLSLTSSGANQSDATSLGQVPSPIPSSELKGELKDLAAEAGGSIPPTFLRLEYHGVPSLSDPAWTAFQGLFKSSYFERLWILQEFVLAPQISIVYGIGQISATELIDSIFYLSRYGSTTLDAYFSQCKWVGLTTLSLEKHTINEKLHADDPNTFLIHKLNLGRTHRASDARDKIYALMGLSSDGNVYAPHIDYSQPYEVVYRNFAKLFVQNGHGIELLYQAGVTSDSENLPSWVPDWNIIDRTLNRVVEHAEISTFKASTSSAAAMQIDDSGYTLTLTAAVFDTVVSVSPILEPLDANHETGSPKIGLVIPDILSFFFSGLEFSRNLTDYPTMEDSLEIFLRTYIRGPPIDISQNEMTRLRKGVRAMSQRLLIGKTFMDKDTTEKRDLYAELQQNEEDLKGLFDAGTRQAFLRRFCITERGYFGLVPWRVQAGDQVAIIAGGPVPFVLRQAEDQKPLEQVYRLVGDGYFHGLMHREAAALDGYVDKSVTLV